MIVNMDNTKPELIPFATRFLKDSSILHGRPNPLNRMIKKGKESNSINSKQVFKNNDHRVSNYVRSNLKTPYVILKWDHSAFNEVIELLITALDRYDELRGAGAK
jgi:hypothetical protein